MHLDKTYLKSHSPSINDNEKVNVNVSVFVKNIFDIKELHMEFKVRLQITMVWFDPRITFKNLRSKESKNIINKQEISKIWLPALFFANSNIGQKTIVDSESNLLVRKLGNHHLNDMNEIHENHLYKGSENPLVLSRSYTVALECKFELRNYPFDHQTCPITLGIVIERGMNLFNLVIGSM